MTKQIAQTYELLDEIQHVRQRTGMYAGSTEITTAGEWVYDPATKKMVKRDVSFIPAFVKIFSEILDNAIDEHRRAPKVLDSIRVEFDQDGTISVTDNGRGIPVEKHPKTGTYVAEMVFSNLRAGSNFNDSEDQQLIGTNGVGSTLTNILSTHFRVESCDGKKMLTQDFYKGMRERTEPKIKAHTKNHTKITFTPDYEFFKLQGLDADHVLKMTKKIADAAACNPGVKFYVNGDRIDVKNFGDYIALYADEYVFDDTEDWKVGVSASDGFEQISFVNSVETYQGGSHVFYVMDQITDALREYIKKKHKMEVKPAEIRTHMRVYISANINRPKFSSQTKENMISQPGTYKTSWTVPDAMVKKLVKSPIIQSVLDWVEMKAKAAELAELRKLNKEASKVNPKHVDKFDDAVEKRDRHLCECYFTEGDCVDENTLVYALTDQGQLALPIKNVKIGDLVLTHNSRFRQVLATSTKLKTGIKVKYDEGEITVSPDHRLMVYHRTLDQFGFVEAGELDPMVHQLVQNQIVRRKIVVDDVLKTTKTAKSISILTEAAVAWDMSDTHKVMVFDKADMSYKVVTANKIKAGDSIAMVPSAKYSYRTEGITSEVHDKTSPNGGESHS